MNFWAKLKTEIHGCSLVDYIVSTDGTATAGAAKKATGTAL